MKLISEITDVPLKRENEDDITQEEVINHLPEKAIRKMRKKQKKRKNINEDLFRPGLSYDDMVEAIDVIAPAAKKPRKTKAPKKQQVKEKLSHHIDKNPELLNEIHSYAGAAEVVESLDTQTIKHGAALIEYKKNRLNLGSKVLPKTYNIIQKASFIKKDRPLIPSKETTDAFDEVMEQVFGNKMVGFKKLAICFLLDVFPHVNENSFSLTNLFKRKKKPEDELYDDNPQMEEQSINHHPTSTDPLRLHPIN